MPLENLKKIIPEKNPENPIPKPPKLFGKAKKSPGRNHRAQASPPAVESVIEAGAAKIREIEKREPRAVRIMKGAARLADMITDADRVRAKDVIRQAMEATNRNYDRAKGGFDEYPDHKTRLAAATLQLAYDEGLPVKREISINGTFESFETVLDRLKQSPEARRMLSSMGMNLDVQKSPVEIEAEFTREKPAEE
jgi:hypothetical protein